MAYNKKEVLQANTEAIRVVLRLEKERCEATEAEKSILRNYQGFGGLKCVLNRTDNPVDIRYWSKSEQKSYPVYRCPKCGQQSVGIYAKVAKCRHETCGFHVFREVCGIHLSEDNIRDLISSGRTPILKGLISKVGKKFNARLALKDDYTTTFEFEQNKKRK